MPPRKATKGTGDFSVREIVLVPHTDHTDAGTEVKLYEAKIMKAELRESMWYYFIHYPGWGKEWDEWVESPGLHKKETEKKEANGVGRLKSSSTPDLDKEGSPAVFEPEASLEPPQEKRPASAQPKRADRKRKASEMAGDAAEEAVFVRIPGSLKQVLLDERDALSQNIQTPKLPRSPTVLELLFQYIENEKNYKEDVDQAEQFSTGLRTYFDKALYQCLLYDHEVEECEKMLEKGIMPSSQYGAEHLLRLLAKLPSLIPITGAPAEGYTALQEQIANFTTYLQSKQSEIVLPSTAYIAAT